MHKNIAPFIETVNHVQIGMHMFLTCATIPLGGRMTTEEKILLRTKMMFVEKGISGTQMTEIAKAVGINRRTLYRYFPTKEHLVCQLQITVSKQLSDYNNRLASHLKSPTGALKIIEYFRHTDYEKLEDMLYLQAQFDSHFTGPYPSPEIQKQMERIQNPTDKGLFGIIAEGQKDGSIKKEFSPAELYTYLNHAYTALQNHIILKRSHFGRNWEKDTDFFDMFLNGFGKSFFTGR